MNADLSTECVLRQIMDEAKTLLGAEAASVFLVDSAQQELYSTVNSTGGELRIPITKGIAGHVASTGEPLVIQDVYSDPRFNKTNDMRTGFRTRNMMCVPLKMKKDNVINVIGVVQVINKTNAGVFCHSQGLSAVSEEGESEGEGFNAQDLQFLLVFANQAATAVANSGGVENENAHAEEVEEAGCSSVCSLVQYCMGRPGAKDTKPEASPKSQMLGVKRMSCNTAGPDSELLSAFSLCPDTAVEMSRQTSTSFLPEKEDRAPEGPTDQPQISALLANAMQSWQFDAFALADLTEEKPLSTLGIHLFQHLGLVKHFEIDSEKLACFFTEIEKGYSSANSYHNAAHAASVLHAMYALLKHGGVATSAAAALQQVPGSLRARANTLPGSLSEAGTDQYVETSVWRSRHASSMSGGSGLEGKHERQRSRSCTR